MGFARLPGTVQTARLSRIDRSLDVLFHSPTLLAISLGKQPANLLAACREAQRDCALRRSECTLHDEIDSRRETGHLDRVRIGNGCGFWGDNLDAPVILAEGGRLDYLTLEYLA